MKVKHLVKKLLEKDQEAEVWFRSGWLYLIPPDSKKRPKKKTKRNK